MINVLSITPGTRLVLTSGAIAEVTENMEDGQWLMIRYLEADENMPTGEEELCHAADISSIKE